MLRTLLIAGISLPLIAAQTVAPKVSDDWLAPLWPDETTSLTAGEQFEIRWTPNITRWFPGYAPSADINNVTLWITGAFQAQYAHVVSPYLNLTRQQGTRWTVNLPDSELQATDVWTFRFLAANETRFSGQNGQQVSSPQLRIRANSTTSLPPARTGPPSSTSSTAVPSLSPTPIPASSSGLSSGATAGIAVGTALLALLLAAIAFFLFRRRRRQRKRKRNATPAPAPEMSAYHDNATTYSPGHAHNLSDGSSGYFPGFGPNSHAQHSGTFSGASTVSSFPGSQGLPAYAQHPPMPMTPQSNVFTPGSDASGHLSQGAAGGQGYYAPTPEKGPGEVPATPVVGNESEVERSELEAPKGGLWRDEGAGARRD
ncbi:hypothetical protein BDZ85DRAFT_66417 [Elsinoe ampelina]|uniref:Ser-Thr-rich glycosyl-phosphatidyl-inositol-anchored membrane family-domain-containing protein n=1 Tax=Elsinoe ampelina TaxID=302913 RepID=A0A6A6GIE4_9PEZI|nr:hypothetical protein BDZ85DRAFT_66417 [Elsinoe ampelina]